LAAYDGEPPAGCGDDRDNDRGPDPLLHADATGDGRVDRLTRLRLTATGARVLAGEADHVALNGVDRWIGGVHLQGHQVPWRWDEGTEAVTTM
jgi:hypothetical protein